MASLAQLKTIVKERLGPLWWYTAVFFCAQRLGDVINIYVGLWLVPRWIPQEQLGAILPLGQVGGLLGLPLAILLTPFLKFLNVFAVRGETGKIKAMLQDALLLVLISALGVAAYTYVASPFVFERLRVGGRALVWILVGLALTNALAPVLSNALQSQERFRSLAAINFFPPFFRLALILMLLPAFAITQYFAVQLLTAALALLIAFWGLRRALAPSVRRVSYREDLPDFFRFTWPIVILTAVGGVQQCCETFVIRHFLADSDSAAFYLISRFAEIPHGVWGAMSIAFFPMVSARHERGEETQRMLWQALLLLLALGGVATLLLTWLAPWLLGLTAAWRVYQPYSWLMGILLLRTLFLQMAACFTTHETACRRFGFAWYAVAISLLESLVLYCAGGIGFFEPYLPARWWRVLAALPTHSLAFVSGIILAASVALVICVLVHGALQNRRARRAGVPA